MLTFYTLLIHVASEKKLERLSIICGEVESNTTNKPILLYQTPFATKNYQISEHSILTHSNQVFFNKKKTNFDLNF